MYCGLMVSEGAVCDYTIQLKGDFHECQLPLFMILNYSMMMVFVPFSIKNHPNICQIRSFTSFLFMGINFHWKITDHQGKVDSFIYNDNTLIIFFLKPGNTKFVFNLNILG